MPSLPYTVVDAFTSVLFKGNPAAVIVVNSQLPNNILQNIAAEFNLSETAFITPIDSSSGNFGLRWFTPQAEVALCGHATLASARVLFSSPDVLPKSIQKIKFQTNVSGILTSKLLDDGRIELELPAGESIPLATERENVVRDSIIQAFTSPEKLVIKSVTTGTGSSYGNYLIIEINDDFPLENTAVKNMDAIKSLAPESLVIIVTQISKTGEETFKLHVFCPAIGASEDPVTGSAHSLLGPYWGSKLGKAVMLG
ncbi:hypothetical protein M422DRAFT_264075 [Sphaerobolus stellatus SS14]|uniref:Uncharacterized protein n=1 Tax=Sphaerobolus stellatus (strain SS14) TaxID=990650 RepID=A0A0C9UGQ7_SPHS4|nr:hypothetical protein M422DRAFT_264075 [Sphaerobolus stellatus SS14]